MIQTNIERISKKISYSVPKPHQQTDKHCEINNYEVCIHNKCMLRFNCCIKETEKLSDYPVTLHKQNSSNSSLTQDL